jgi:hypothetical protein
LTAAAFTWSDIVRETARPLLYAIPLLAVVLLLGRELLINYRGTRSITLSAATTVLTVAGLAIVAARLVALTR